MDIEEIFLDDKDDYLFKDDNFCERMDEDLDFAIAFSFQMELNETIEASLSNNLSSVEKSVEGKCQNNAKPLSIIDEQWELIDPHPDIHALFLEYNIKFFYGKLEGVEVKWSPRMKLCAGVCSYEGRGGLCSVRLSAPLLQLRPRKDLVETLLHEMIHAYLFVTHNNKDHNDHGPEFLKHMYRINKETGTTISVYHSFHDEVDLYRTHWWKCDGPCQKRRPFYGLVKRSMNRAPGPTDTWWAQHQSTCGGNFIKIREPENFGNKKATKRKPNCDDSKDSGIRRFFSNSSGKINSLSETSSSMKGKRLKSTSTIAGKTISSNVDVKDRSESSNISGIKTIFSKDANTDINGSNSVLSEPQLSSKKQITPFSGTGCALGSSSSNASRSQSILLDKFSNVNKTSSFQNETFSEKKFNKIPQKILSTKQHGKTHNGSKIGKGEISRSPISIPSKSSKSSNTHTNHLVQSPIKTFFHSSPKKVQSNRTLTNSEIILDIDSPSCNREENYVNCPVCSILVQSSQINFHLDRCLSECV